MSNHQEPMDTSPIDPSIDMHGPPPTEDAPTHILNILNNFCIQAIFERIDNVRDYYNVANVCTRFQANAIRCFPAKFNYLKVYDDEKFSDNIPRFNELPLSETTSILSIFGHLIHSIKWFSKTNQTNSNDVLSSIAQHCGNTLKHLDIQLPNMLDWTHCVRNLTALEKLDVFSCCLTSFESQSPLKELKIVSDNRSIPVTTWFVQNFPHLESISLQMIKNLTDEMVIDFLNLNSQLRNIRILYCMNLSTAIFNDIGRRVPNVEEFCFETWNSRVSFDDNMRHLGQLRLLKNLAIAARIDGDELVQLLIENHIPIEILNLDAFNDNLANAPIMAGLTNLTLHNVSNDVLERLVEKYPQLKDLHVTRLSGASMDCVKKILESGRNLKTLSFCVTDFDVDLEAYNTVWALAKDRVKLQMNINVGRVSVPSDTIKANSKWFNLITLRPRE